jgi:hypothetical protein
VPGLSGYRRCEVILYLDDNGVSQAFGLACRVLGLNARWRFVMLPNIVSWLALLSPLALAIALVRKYLRTRDIGFVWLGVAGVIWPLVSGLLVSGLLIQDKAVLITHHFFRFYPFSLHRQASAGSVVVVLWSVQQLIGVGLLLVAVLYLHRMKANSTVQTA